VMCTAWVDVSSGSGSGSFGSIFLPLAFVSDLFIKIMMKDVSELAPRI